MSVSPDLALVHRIHVRAQRTPEIVAEVFQIGERADYTETAGRMESGRDAVLERFRTVLGTPHVGCAHPEHLLRRVVLQTGQTWLDAVTLGPHVVRVIRLFHASVVGNVLALRVDAVQLEHEIITKTD